MVRIIKYLLAAVLILAVVVSAAGLIIARYYQDEVKQLVITEINRHVTTEIMVGDLSFSVLRRFPRASLEFRDVVILAPEEFRNSRGNTSGTDTLFTARNLYLRFNIKDIFNRQYNISSLSASSGMLNPAINSAGTENYRFWKQDTASDGTLAIDLQDVRLIDYHIRYSNRLKNLYFETDLERLYMKGSFGSSRQSISGIASGRSRELRYGDFVYSENSDIELRASIDVDGGLFVVENGTIILEGITLTAAGSFVPGEEGSIDLDIKGYNIGLSSAVTLLPEKTTEKLEDYRFSGRFDFDASIRGTLSRTSSPAVTASFGTENSEIKHKASGVSLKNTRLRGHYAGSSAQKTGSSAVTITGFSAELGKGHISGSGTLSDFPSPEVDFSLSADLFLEELARFYRPANISYMAGNIKTAFSCQVSIGGQVEHEIEIFNRMNLTGKLEIQNGAIELSEGRYVARDIEGELNFGQILNTPGLSFYIGEDHFRIRGEIDNGLPWLLGEQQVMSIKGSFYSSQLVLDNYIRTSGNNRSAAAEPLKFPDNIELNLDFLVDRLGFGKFSSTSFTGKMSYRPGMLVMNSLGFDSMDGALSGNGVIYQRINGEFMVQSQLELDRVDINKMFAYFSNFGQNFIDSDNLKGTLSGSLSLLTEWSNDLKIIEENLIADSRLVIKDGELIDFEPMLGLARFIDVDELQHIRFSQLQNEIFIRNRVVTIPQMDIHSSAFNISGSGTHNFDGIFDYRLRVLLSDVLYGKARKSRPETDRFGVVEDDGLGRTSLYLLVAGTPDDYRVAFDQRAVRDMIRDNLANERNVLRQILNEEFGWFSREEDGGDPAEMTAPAGSGFRIVWDEEDEKQEEVAAPETMPPAGQRENQVRFRIIWDEEEKPAGPATRERRRR